MNNNIQIELTDDNNLRMAYGSLPRKFNIAEMFSSEEEGDAYLQIMEALVGEYWETKATSYAAFYANSSRFLETLVRFGDGGAVEGMTLQDFHANFTYVGTYKGQAPDDVFGLLQNGGGGLGVSVNRDTGEVGSEVSGKMMQELLVRKIGHTSMSKGDVLVDLDTGEVMLCASSGWDKLVITGMREAR